MTHDWSTVLFCQIYTELFCLDSPTFYIGNSFLATQYDRLLARYCRLSVYLSVTKCILALRVGARVLKVVRRFPRRALPIHFFRHFCCKKYPLAATHSANRTEEISASGIAMDSMVTWPWLFQTRHFRQFGSAAIPYVVRTTEYDRPSWRQLRFLFLLYGFVQK